MARVVHKRAVWHGEEVQLCQQVTRYRKGQNPLMTEHMSEVTCSQCQKAYSLGVPQQIGPRVETVQANRWWEND